jgi:hypothetical protein
MLLPNGGCNRADHEAKRVTLALSIWILFLPLYVLLLGEDTNEFRYRATACSPVLSLSQNPSPLEYCAQGFTCHFLIASGG